MIQDFHLYSNNADACESLVLVDARRLESLDTNWFAVAFTDGDLASLVEFRLSDPVVEELLLITWLGLVVSDELN